MIEITDRMRRESDRHFDEVCKSVDRCIEMAVKNHDTFAYFACDPEGDRDVYSRVRKTYENAGYTIRPYGYSNGVWQKSEIICW